MPDASSLALFTVAAITLLVIPGPSVLYIVTRSVDQGRAAGLASVGGIHVGTLVHVAAAALGLSALLVSSATAYNAVRWLGAAYLVWLGVRRLLARDEEVAAAAGPEARRHGLGRVFAQGVVVNVLNPKTALFFFAFLPQFVDVARGSVRLQVVVFGAAYLEGRMPSEAEVRAATAHRGPAAGVAQQLLLHWLSAETTATRSATRPGRSSRRG